MKFCVKECKPSWWFAYPDSLVEDGPELSLHMPWGKMVSLLPLPPCLHSLTPGRVQGYMLQEDQ